MKKGIVLPEGFQEIPQGEMEIVAGGTVRCPVKGDRDKHDSWREFIFNFFHKKK